MALRSVNTLTSNDTSVLEALFDPEASLASPDVHKALSLPVNRPNQVIDPTKLINEQRALRLINSLDPDLVDIQTALSHLTNICETSPEHASGWCNLAQARRLFLSKSCPIHEGETEAEHFSRLARTSPQSVRIIFNDLANAIKLASPTPSSSQASPLLSVSQARVLAAAHTHRGYLLLLLSRGARENEAETDEALPQSLSGLSKEKLEEMASAEFALGGKYGNQMAKQASVTTNPYAKLCGNIVREAMRKEIEEYQNCTMIERAL